MAPGNEGQQAASAGGADGEREPAACEPGLAADFTSGWIWGDPADGIPADAPLHALLLAASRVMGAFYAGTVVQAGLRISPAGLGVLRVLLAEDGLKSSDVASPRLVVTRHADLRGRIRWSARVTWSGAGIPGTGGWSGCA